MAGKRNIKLIFPELEPGLCVLADKTRFHQVLINLINNAIKYSPDDSDVQIRTIPGHNRVQIFIIDKGPGIAEDKIKELFMPFNRLGAEQSTIKGTGIGLAISKDLIEMMNGQIGLDSTLGHGCCFWIELPLAEGN
jgi:signal transduction histidine kinase